jgi:hypothetical protein
VFVQRIIEIAMGMRLVKVKAGSNKIQEVVKNTNILQDVKSNYGGKPSYMG